MKGHMSTETKASYNYPERSDWTHLINSHKLSELAEWCIRTARNQEMLIAEQRHLLPGLRCVLQHIAEMEAVELT